MRAEVETVSLQPVGPLGRLAMGLVRRMPPGAGRKAARLFWRLGLLRRSS